jgi:hypothetical protein
LSGTQAEVQSDVGVESDPDARLDWETAPDDFRAAHRNASDQVERLKQELAKHAADRELIGDLRAELTFVKAGIDVDSIAGGLFAAKYDGPLDVDSVEEAYSRYLSDARAESKKFMDHLTRTNGGQSA